MRFFVTLFVVLVCCSSVVARPTQAQSVDQQAKCAAQAQKAFAEFRQELLAS